MLSYIMFRLRFSRKASSPVFLPMGAVQIIPFSGKPLEFANEGTVQMRFSFSEQGFLLGQENGILEPLIQEIVDGRIAPERQPILLYGVPGSGRTHILRGILETWRKNQTDETVRRRACYSTCADFIRHFNESIATRMTEEFRRRYHRAELILLDDLEQFFGKHAAQTELRLLLDTFATKAGVIVITAKTLSNDKKNGGTEGLSAELTARIHGGTAIPIFPPGEAVRQRFLQDLASALRIPVEETSLNTVAKELTGTIPQLYAVVAQKYVETKATNEPLNLTFWQQFSKTQQSHNIKDLTETAKRIAAYFSLKLHDLKGESRCKTVAYARSIAVYLAKTQHRLTFKEIGYFFGKRDPSTVRHLFDKVLRNLKTDSELRDHLYRLEPSFRKTDG